MNAPLPVAAKQQMQMTAADVRSHVNLIQEVMQAVMKDGVHFGKIPGTPKPSLWKAGAEKIAQAFHIAVSYRIEELPIDIGVRYRVTAVGTHQMSGVVMGEGVGECSSSEEKYKWRKATSNREFENFPDNLRRKKFGYDKQARKEYEVQQVRTEPADVANTILKMACKRAQVAMTLNVTAASDIFTQDIEDLPPELLDDDDGQQRDTKKDTGLQPYPDEGFQKNLPTWRDLITTGKKTAEQIIATVSSKGTLTQAQKDQITWGKPSPEPEKKQEANAGAPKVTFAIVMDKLQKAVEVDVLDVHASLIAEVPDADQREELTEFYQTRRATLTKS